MASPEGPQFCNFLDNHEIVVSFPRASSTHQRSAVCRCILLSARRGGYASATNCRAFEKTRRISNRTAAPRSCPGNFRPRSAARVGPRASRRIEETKREWLDRARTPCSCGDCRRDRCQSSGERSAPLHRSGGMCREVCGAFASERTLLNHSKVKASSMSRSQGRRVCRPGRRGGFP